MGSAAVPGDDRYPDRRLERDRFVVAQRHPAARPKDPWKHQGVLVERERTATGALADIATIFLTGRECPWRCVMCDLWRHTIAEDTPAGAIPRQIAAAVEELQHLPRPPAHVKLYNAGSFFDVRAVPPVDDDEIVHALASFAHVIVEAHPALVGDRTWRLRDALARQRATLEVAMGLETADPVALQAINKGITLERFAHAAARLEGEGVALRVFVLVSPPFVRAADQDRALTQSVRFAAACGASAISLIPTRPGEGALDALAAAGRFAPPALCDIERSTVLARAAASEGSAGRAAVRVFVDVWELDRFAACPACQVSRRARLEAFNHTQLVPPPIACDGCHEVTPA